MSISHALNVARSSLATTSEQMSVVSRNMASAQDPGATRKSANVVTVNGGGTRIASITRASNSALFNAMLVATSSSGAQRAIVDALDRLEQTVNDPELDSSPAAMIQKLSDALQQYEAAPQDTLRAGSAVAAAQALANSLNDATRTVQNTRRQADADIATSVSNLNTLLARFEDLNNAIIAGTRSGNDVTDYLDQRDQVLAGISQEVGIRTVTRGDNDMALYTDSGVALFERTARKVEFDRTLIYTAGTVGNPVMVDGIPITGGVGAMSAGSGRLVGLTAVRDQATVAYQSQLDEIARGLINAFAESDQSASPTLPDVPGLFTYPGAPAMPTDGTIYVGLAGAIQLNPNVDPDQGGDYARLRDGGISDPSNPAYVYNPNGDTGYSGRLHQYIANLSENVMTFDPDAQLATSGTVIKFASDSVGWFEELRKSASEVADYQDTVLQKSTEAVSRTSGINIEEEMIKMLDYERSYQASSKLISTIDSMLEALLSAV
jgi:flagellar hook-associated protein 1 FlgK